MYALLSLLTLGAAIAGDPSDRVPEMTPIEEAQLASSQDTDRDGFHNGIDNCVSLYNAGQEDADGDEVGDACDLCPQTAAFGELHGCPESAADPAAVSALEARTLEQLRNPCTVGVRAGLDDATWTLRGGTATEMWVEVRNLTDAPIVPSWSDTCPCGPAPGSGLVGATGLPPVDGASCDGHMRMKDGCHNMGACNPHRTFPSVTLAPGAAPTRLPDTFPLNPAGVGCYSALPEEGPLVIHPLVRAMPGPRQADSPPVTEAEAASLRFCTQPLVLQ